MLVHRRGRCTNITVAVIQQCFQFEMSCFLSQIHAEIHGLRVVLEPCGRFISYKNEDGSTKGPRHYNPFTSVTGASNIHIFKS